MNYTFQIKNSHQHFIKIIVQANVASNSEILVQLPSWRPGRYELADFAKNVKDFQVVDDKGHDLEFHKINKDSWRILNNEQTSIQISYLYYAAELNAGSTFLDENQLYINPINCCMYLPDRMDEPCFVNLDVPDAYETVTSLVKSGAHKFKANDFHELVDSPIISSSTLQCKKYKSNGVTFNLCFQGEIKIDWERTLKDFSLFTDYQIQKFNSFPVKDYYFLFQITPYPSYHGVEHQRSTVILLGPSYAIFNKNYSKLLGISSHELYHTWNVKTIRPNDMLPYDYSKENYTKMGYVTEGVTTYMGDRILYESGVFSENDYFKELSSLMLRHFHNDGRRHYSVAESSFDSWLDGYVAGVPGRKVSIYVEGALIALICDARIRKSTDHQVTLHDVIKQMYSGNEKIVGYDENSYIQILKKLSGTSFDDIFNDLINGRKEFISYLNEAFKVYGWKLIKKSSNRTTWNFGMKGIWVNNAFKITHIVEGSTADTSGLIPDDRVHSVNGYKLNNDIDDWLNYFGEDEKVLSFEREGVLKRLTLNKINNFQFWNYSIEK